MRVEEERLLGGADERGFHISSPTTRSAGIVVHGIGARVHHVNNLRAD
jgi:hypothetical protein